MKEELFKDIIEGDNVTKLKNEVCDALKKMDKSITLQELNEKLTKQVAEPDLPEAPDDDIDV